MIFDQDRHAAVKALALFRQGTGGVGELKPAYCLLFATVGLAVALAVALTSANPAGLFYFKLYSVMGQLWLFPALVWLGGVAIMVVRRRFDRPTKAIVRIVIRERWHLLFGMALTLMAVPFIQSFSVLKSAIPRFVNFYADPVLAEMDRLLFLGTDPWRVTHALLGPAATQVLDLAYVVWFPVMFAMMGWLNFSRDRRFQVRGLLTFYLSWFLLGFIMATMLSSVGPCFYADFYGDGRFTPLMQIIEAQPLKAVKSMAFLRSTLNSGELGSGISAMPSLHVGMAFMTFIVCREGIRWRWPSYVALAYFALIFVASVHLGWHYAVDGLVSVLSVAAIWKATGRITRPHGQVR